MQKTLILLFSLTFSFTVISCSDDYSEYVSLPKEKIEVGKAIFTDTNLSNPTGQSCASCHGAEKAFSDPKNSAISNGAITTAFGNRNAPSLSYNIFSPVRFYNSDDQTYVGGLFLDGRSPNLQEQFIHPMLNPVEMNNTDKAMVASKIKTASYYTKLVAVYGNPASDTDLLSYVADALATFQKSAEVNSFTSKFDYVSKGLATYTEEEKKGLDLFKGKGKCAQCHILDPDERTGKVLFTDFTYDNIGVPKNPTNPFYNQPATINPAGVNYIDLGLGAIVNESQHNGKFRVPTLRNIAVTGPYFHNGAIATLREAIHFYNVRDLNTGEFSAPEYNTNVNDKELGDLKLTPTEEILIEKFLLTLTDHYRK